MEIEENNKGRCIHWKNVPLLKSGINLSFFYTRLQTFVPELESTKFSQNEEHVHSLAARIFQVL